MLRAVTVAVVLAACGGTPKPTELPDPTETAAPPAEVAVATAAAAGLPPIAAVVTVRDTYHGVAVDDPYRWLEGEGADVKRWSDAQNAHARGILDALPEVDVLRAEITAIVKAPITRYGSFAPAGKRLFGFRKDPDKEQTELIVMDGPEGAAKLLFDPTAGGSAHRSIDWFVPSPDGSRVAVSISENGSERGDLHVLDLDGKLVDAVIPDVNRGTGGGDVAWAPDGKRFYYTRYPAQGEKPEPERDFWMQVWVHTVGTPVASDRYELGKDLPKIAEIVLESDRKGRVLAKVQNGDGGEFRHYLRDGNGAWRQLDDWPDGIVYVGFGTTDDLWVISHQDAPRGKVMRLAANAKTAAAAKLVLPEGKDAIVTDFYGADWGVVDGGDRIYVTYQVGGPTELRAFTRTGKATTAPALPAVASSGKPVVWRDGVIVFASSFLTPPSWYRFSAKSSTTSLLAAVSPRPPVDLSSFEAIREHATSKDGTQIPFTVLWPKGSPKDGSVPCVATGYGGYGLSETPGYFANWWPLLRRGVCFVQTNLRGGAEFGEAWHRAGMLTTKQNVFDDFTAVLASLVDRKYTARERLGILGGSNGGLLMGATLTQHPELVKAVVSLVGIYDSLRAEISSNGAYNIPEFGTVKDPAQFAALHAYSPYHHVAKARYPAVLMVTGDNDARVPPWHSRKMAAALLAAQTGDAPILLRTSATSGHGGGTAASEFIEERAHTYAFLLAQLK